MISPRMSEMIARALEPIEEEIIPTTATTYIWAPCNQNIDQIGKTNNLSSLNVP